MRYLTRTESFNAAHKLWVDAWSPEKNREVFGKCANANWHGHNYRLHVTVKGAPDPYTGFIIDAKKLGDIIQRVIIEQLDHKNLNLDVDFIPKDIQPTTEHVVYYIWHELAPHIHGCTLHKIELWETDKIAAYYKGE